MSRRPRPWLLVILLILVPLLLTASVSRGEQASPPSAPKSKESDAPRSVSSVVEKEVERSIAKVEPLLQRYGYAASFFAVMGEGIGIPLPGGTLLIASGLDAAKGGMNIGVLLVVVTLAAWLGNSIGYLIGRWGGRTLLEKLRVNQQYLKRVEGLFDRRGGAIILIARFVDGLRQLNGIVAGMLAMPWWTFTLYNVAGALLYVFAWGMGAYVLEKDIHPIIGFVHQYSALSMTLSLAAFAALLVYLFQRKRT